MWDEWMHDGAGLGIGEDAKLLFMMLLSFMPIIIVVFLAVDDVDGGGAG